MTTNAQRVLVIGLDGASPELVRRWTESGDLPVLRGLIERGSLSPLLSTIPPISPAAWCTFSTGCNPAQHGVLDFRNLDVRRYEYHEPDIVTSHPIAGKTFWDYAGACGKRVGVFWVPITYPPWQVNGLLVSGYPTPSASKAFGYPESAVAAMAGLTEDSALFHSARPKEMWRELARLTHERAQCAAQTMRREAFDLCVVVLGSIDRAQHDFWRHHDPQSPVHDRAEANEFGATILDIYRASDRAVADLLASTSPDTTVFIVSDHGGGPAPTKALHLNAWLRQKGFLSASAPSISRRALNAIYCSLRDRFPAKEQLYRRLSSRLRAKLTSLDAAASFDLGAVEWPKTQAYRFPLYNPHEGIAINLAGRQLHGCVTHDEYEPLRERLLGELAALTDTDRGKPIVIRAFRREDIYSGPQIARFPDIVIEMDTDYAAGAGLWGDWLTPVPDRQLRKLSGTHRMEGILMAAGPIVQCAARAEQPNLADIAPTVLYALGSPRPAAMDGRVLTEIFNPGHIARHPPKVSEIGWTDSKIPDRAFSLREQAEIAEQLRALGYID